MVFGYISNRNVWLYMYVRMCGYIISMHVYMHIVNVSIAVFAE